MTDPRARIAAECDAIKAMLLEKNASYGNSALEPLRIFSSTNPTEQLRVRIDDKLSRLARGAAAGEDTILDLIGYLILLRVAERQGGTPADTESPAAPDSPLGRFIGGPYDGMVLNSGVELTSPQRDGYLEYAPNGPFGASVFVWLPERQVTIHWPEHPHQAHFRQRCTICTAILEPVRGASPPWTANQPIGVCRVDDALRIEALPESALGRYPYCSPVRWGKT